MQPSTVNGTELGAQECRDDAFLRYDLDPPDLPKYCDGYNTRFSICHALYCKRGGLVTVRHNELHDRVVDLDGKDFTPPNVRNDPPHLPGLRREEEKSQACRDQWHHRKR